MLEHLLALNVNMYVSVVSREKNENNEKAKEVIMKVLSKTDVDKVNNCKLTMEMLDILQCIYGGDSHVAQEETEEPCCPRYEP